jgi:penicillin-binding protein 2
MTNPEQPSIQFRLTIIIVVVACLFSALVARLWFLQVVNVDTAQQVAADNGIRTIYVPAQRGRILDNTGAVLVGNVNVSVIEVNRQVAGQNPQMLRVLAPLLNMTVPALQTAINNTQYSPYAPVPVATGVSPQQILYVQENQSMFPGVTATTTSERQYTPAGEAAANVVGYVGQIGAAELSQLKSKGYQAGDQIGLTGIEAEYESLLRGTPGVERVQVDSKGNVLGTLSYTPPVPGDDIELTINGNAQMAAEQALSQGEAAARATFDPVTNRNFSAPAGSAVVEDPQTGQIIALATNPTYPVQEFVGGISEANYQALLNDPQDPLLDRTIQGQYAPGSTFKLITATAGLENCLITATSIFDDTGSIQIGTFTAHNDNGAVYGPIDLSRAITVSSDNFFNKIGLDLWYDYTGGTPTPPPCNAKVGPDALQKVASAYGLGSPTGIDLPNEASGKIPTPASYMKDYEQNPVVFGGQKGVWYPGNSDQVAIGQDEDLVTPLQLANAYSAFANGGTLYAPILVKAALTPAGKVVENFQAKVKNTIPLHPDWRAAMLAGFEGVVNASGGTAYGVFNGPQYAAMDIAGKTGTAQVTSGGRQDTSVFTSFAPAHGTPQYVVDAFMEDAGYGSSVAAPVVREIYDALYNQPLQPVSYSATGSGGQN